MMDKLDDTYNIDKWSFNVFNYSQSQLISLVAQDFESGTVPTWFWFGWI